MSHSTSVFPDTLAHLEHPSVRKWAESAMEERKQLWAERGRAEEEAAQLGDVKVGSKVDAKANGVANGHANGNGNHA